MLKIYLHILPTKIAWLKFILEGYDGLAVLTTVDATSGIVSLAFHGTRSKEIIALLEAMSVDLTPFAD